MNIETLIGEATAYASSSKLKTSILKVTTEDKKSLKEFANDTKEFANSEKEFANEVKFRKEFVKAQRAIYKLISSDPKVSTTYQQKKYYLCNRF